jgi:hypothetical protein
MFSRVGGIVGGYKEAMARGGDGKVREIGIQWMILASNSNFPIFSNLYHSLPLFTTAYQSFFTNLFSLLQLFSLFFTSSS